MLGQLSPLFVCYSFLIDLSEAGLPRMTSTALRWTPKRHPFICPPQHPTHQNNPTNGSKVRRGFLFFVCLTTFPTKKMLKAAHKSAFGRCKHLLRADKWLKTRSSLTLRRSSRTSEICSSDSHCSSRRILLHRNDVPSPSIGNTPQTASTYQGQPPP